MFHNKPIIGIAGGIGSGKSFVAKLFGEQGCGVIDSDASVREIYERPAVQQVLRTWWGAEVLTPAGGIDRKAVAKRVFAEPAERERLERLVHPMVNQLRIEQMNQMAEKSPVLRAFVWDTPLLFETGLNRECDAVAFVDCPIEIRLKRVAARGWSAEELSRRECQQWPIEKKREACDASVVNSGESSESKQQLIKQIAAVLDAIVAKSGK